MQQVATEIRLLGVLLRQHEANAKYEPAPAPFLVTPAQRAGGRSVTSGCGRRWRGRRCLRYPCGLMRIGCGRDAGAG